jgi:hypothetical protein
MNNEKSVQIENQGAKATYEAPAIVSVANVPELVRGGSGFQSDGPNFQPF